MSKGKTYPSKTETNRKKKSELPIVQEVEIIYSRPLSLKPIEINSSKIAYETFLLAYDKRKIDYKEMFYVLLLNRKNYCLGIAKVSEGSTVATIVNEREIFQLALKTNATAILVSHNHPSGNTQPSEADNQLTRKLNEACKLLDIQLLDHIIVTSNGYYSYADEGIL